MPLSIDDIAFVGLNSNPELKSRLARTFLKRGIDTIDDDTLSAGIGSLGQQPPDLMGTMPITVDKPASQLEAFAQPQAAGGNRLPQQISSGLMQFAKSFGQGATGTPVDMGAQGAGWQNRLGATIGSQFGQAAMDKLLWGQPTTSAPNVKPTFYNEPQEISKLDSELEKSIKLQKIKDELEINKLERAIKATGGRAKMKSITSSGDITFDVIPTEEEVQAELDIKKREEAIKPPTAEQSKVNTFVNRMLSAEKVLSDIDSSGMFGAGDLFAQAKSPSVVGMQASTPNVMKNPKMQKFDQAKRNFVNAVLRRESGAAISPSEFANADLQYFRQPGDSQEVVAQKAENRRIAIEGMKKEAGKAFSEISPETGEQGDGLSDEEAYKIYLQKKGKK